MSRHQAFDLAQIVFRAHISQQKIRIDSVNISHDSKPIRANCKSRVQERTRLKNRRPADEIPLPYRVRSTAQRNETCTKNLFYWTLARGLLITLIKWKPLPPSAKESKARNAVNSNLPSKFSQR